LDEVQQVNELNKADIYRFSFIEESIFFSEQLQKYVKKKHYTNSR
jgi:hypothetical protein